MARQTDSKHLLVAALDRQLFNGDSHPGRRRRPKRWRGCGKATFTARVTYSAIFCKTIGQIANRLGQKLPFRTGNRFQQLEKNPSFMHGKGWFAEGVDAFRGAYLARHATPAPKRRGDLRGRGPLAPPLQTVSEIVGYPPKSCNK